MADYWEKITSFLFKTVSYEDLNKRYQKRDKHELPKELRGDGYCLTVDPTTK